MGFSSVTSFAHRISLKTNYASGFNFHFSGTGQHSGIVSKSEQTKAQNENGVMIKMCCIEADVG